MLVERVSITNDAPAISYTYGDFSGTWESIIVQSPPGSTPPQLVADLPPLVNATTAPESVAPAPEPVATPPAGGAPVPENSPPSQEVVGDELRAEGPIEEDDDDNSQSEDEEADVPPAVFWRS